MNTNNTSLREDRVQVLERSELSNKRANKMLRFFLQTGRAHGAQMSQSNRLASFPLALILNDSRSQCVKQHST